MRHKACQKILAPLALFQLLASCGLDSGERIEGGALWSDRKKRLPQRALKELRPEEFVAGRSNYYTRLDEIDQRRNGGETVLFTARPY